MNSFKKKEETNSWQLHVRCLFLMLLKVVLNTYLAVLGFLEITLSKDGPDDKKKKGDFKVELDYLKSYRFLWAVLTFKKMFDIMSPTSSILPNKDLVLAVSTNKRNKIKITKLRTDNIFEHLSQEIDAFVLE